MKLKDIQIQYIELEESPILIEAFFFFLREEKRAYGEDTHESMVNFMTAGCKVDHFL